MTTQVTIVGAGYAGLAAASRLARRTRGRDVRIELVNAVPDFVERIRLHQLAAGTGSATRPLTDVLAGTDVSVRIGTVEAIDASRGAIRLTDGTNVGYDTLVYALGSRTRTDGVPGAAAYAYTVDSPAGARRLNGALRTAGTVAVCGGGLTGIEVAGEIAETYPGVAVTLLTRGRLAETVSARTRRYLSDTLGRLGVTVRERTEVTAVEPDAVRLADGSALPADVTVWCGSFVAPRIAVDSGLPTDDAGGSGSTRPCGYPGIPSCTRSATPPRSPCPGAYRGCPARPACRPGCTWRTRSPAGPAASGTGSRTCASAWGGAAA